MGASDFAGADVFHKRENRRRQNMPAAAAFIMLSQPQPLTMSRVSRAMTSSSLVGITKSFTLLSAVEMQMSSPRFLFGSGSISQPR